MHNISLFAVETARPLIDKRHHHLTVTLPPEVFLGVIRGVGQSALTAGFKVADIDELYDYVMDDLNKRINPNCRWSKKIADVRKANRMEIT